MRFYPAAPYRRAATIGADVAVVLLLMLFAALALAVNEAVSGLAEIPGSIEKVGTETRGALQDAATDVASLPIVGDSIADALRDAGTRAGGGAVEVGQNGREQVERTANVLAFAVFVIPALLLLVGYGPNRYAQIERLTAARKAMGGTSRSSEHARTIAMRAAFSLPYTTLLRHTKDPFGDLERGDYQALVRAAREEAGLPLDG